MRISAPVLFALAGTLGTAAPARLLRAQSKDSTSSDDESHQVPPTFATGATVGTLRFAGGRTENAISVILLYHPLPWLKLGDSAATLGMGSNTLEASAALSLSPTERLNLSADVAHPLAANSGNGSVSLESSLSFGRATGNVGLNAEVGRPDSGAVLSRSLAAGVAWTLAGPLTLTVDGSHGVSGSAPTWALSIGVGTAFGAAAFTAAIPSSIAEAEEYIWLVPMGWPLAALRVNLNSPLLALASSNIAAIGTSWSVRVPSSSERTR